MNRTTVIINGTPEDRIAMAEKMITGKNSLWLMNLDDNWERGVPVDTEVIVIHLWDSDMDRFKKLITSDFLTFRPMFAREYIKIQTPDVIGIYDSLKFEPGVLRRAAIIDLLPDEERLLRLGFEAGINWKEKYYQHYDPLAGTTEETETYDQFLKVPDFNKFYQEYKNK